VWRLVWLPEVDPDTREPTGRERLYGIAVVRLAPRRFLHVRAFADFRGTCTEADRREGVVADAFCRLLRTARVEARRTSRPEISDDRAAILAAVAQPDLREDDPRRGRERFWRRRLGQSGWLFVVVDFEQSPGRVVTAFGRRDDPPGWWTR
jgi:hypothetical protein